MNNATTLTIRKTQNVFGPGAAFEVELSDGEWSKRVTTQCRSAARRYAVQMASTQAMLDSIDPQLDAI
jgi:hypothetical protein